ncbi:hypothetical protein EAI_08252, partial [Harpegnathos saltator]
KLRAEIDLLALGISGLRPKRAVTGALILEVPGEGGAERAQKLVPLMEAALAGSGVRVARPVRRAELRVTGLVEATTKEEVIETLARAGGCLGGEIRVGEIRRPPTGLSTAWAQVPLAAARRIAAVSERRELCVGWVIVRAEVLATRPLQCYRCLEIGHPRQRCQSAVDRSDRCYRCGQPGHRAVTCTAS